MDTTIQPLPAAPVATASSAPTLATRWRPTWAAIRAGFGAVLGLVPHVMHHIGFIAGAAVLTGVVGNSVLYLVGLALSIPLLRRIQRRFGTWKAPAIGVAVFTTMFAISAFVIGPALNPVGTAPAPSAAVAPPAPADPHAGHHG